MSLHHEVRADHQKFAQHRVKRADGGKIAEIEDDAKAADAKTAKASHRKMNLRHGGKVAGAAPKERLDKRARGGAMKGKHKHAGVKIEIHTGGAQAGQQLGQMQGQQEGMKMGAQMAAQKMAAAQAPKPPMAPPPGMPPPPAGMPPRPPMGMNGPPPGMMRARGGATNPDMTAGAGSGEGRLEKQGKTDMIPVKAHTRRARGGKTEC